MKWLLTVFLTILVCFQPASVSAEASPEELEKKVQEIDMLRKRISQLQGEAKTLGQTIDYLNNKKLLTQKQIETTEYEIALLESEIDSIEGKIGILNETLDDLTELLLKDVQATYKRQKTSDVESMFSSKSFTQAYSNYKYRKFAQDFHQQLLKKTTQARMDYDTQKLTKESKQKTIETLRKKLETQKKDLEVQEGEKRKLLTDTRSSEANYQKLLNQAEAELSSLRSFSVSRGANVLPPQNSPDGWFYSQRDERWAGVCIGNSCGTKSEGKILDVGCLVSSTAMVKKKFGEEVTPVSIARTSSYFFSNTAYMLQPWPAPSGYQYVRQSYSQDKLDSELREGRPVIMHLRIGTSDGHFIVIKSGEKGNYVMHDPIEGYDKSFTQFYRTSQINNMNYLRKV